MEENLAHAREMAFRHKEEKYKETMRVFHISETEVRVFFNIYILFHNGVRSSHVYLRFFWL